MMICSEKVAGVTIKSGIWYDSVSSCFGFWDKCDLPTVHRRLKQIWMWQLMRIYAQYGYFH